MTEHRSTADRRRWREPGGVVTGDRSPAEIVRQEQPRLPAYCGCESQYAFKLRSYWDRCSIVQYFSEFIRGCSVIVERLLTHRFMSPQQNGGSLRRTWPVSTHNIPDPPQTSGNRESIHGSIGTSSPGSADPHKETDDGLNRVSRPLQHS